MKITVTKADIEGGRRRDPNDCAIARALHRAGITHFGVMGMLVAVEIGRQQTSLFLPGPVQEWILDFDWGLPVQPIEFELALPRGLEKKVASPGRRERSPSAGKSPDHSRVTIVAGIAGRLGRGVKGLLKSPRLRSRIASPRGSSAQRSDCALRA